MPDYAVRRDANGLSADGLFFWHKPRGALSLLLRWTQFDAEGRTWTVEFGGALAGRAFVNSYEPTEFLISAGEERIAVRFPDSTRGEIERQGLCYSIVWVPATVLMDPTGATLLRSSEAWRDSERARGIEWHLHARDDVEPAIAAIYFGINVGAFIVPESYP